MKQKMSLREDKKKRLNTSLIVLGYKLAFVTLILKFSRTEFVKLFCLAVRLGRVYVDSQRDDFDTVA